MMEKPPQRDLMLCSVADTMQQAALLLQKLADRMERQEKNSEALMHQIEKLDHAVFGVDSDKPGMGLRLDRIEQRYLRAQKVQNWILGGGVISLVTGLVFLYKAIETLAHSESLK